MSGRMAVIPSPLSVTTRFISRTGSNYGRWNSTLSYSRTCLFTRTITSPWKTSSRLLYPLLMRSRHC